MTSRGVVDVSAAVETSIQHNTKTRNTVRTWNFGLCNAPLEKSHYQTNQLRSCHSNQTQKSTYQNQLTILPHTPKPVIPSPSPLSPLIKRHAYHEARMSLTTSDDAGFPRGEDGEEVVLAAGEEEAAVGGPGEAGEGAEVGREAGEESKGRWG